MCKISTFCIFSWVSLEKRKDRIYVRESMTNHQSNAESWKSEVHNAASFGTPKRFSSLPPQLLLEWCCISIGFRWLILILWWLWGYCAYLDLMNGASTLFSMVHVNIWLQTGWGRTLCSSPFAAWSGLWHPGSWRSHSDQIPVKINRKRRTVTKSTWRKEG